MKRPLIIAFITAFAACSYVAYASYQTVTDLSSYSVVAPNPETLVSQEEIPSSSVEHDYGNVTLRLNETAVFKDVRITPLRIVEDSRCPTDVQCIQAGAVRVELETVSAMGTSTDVLGLGKSLTTEAEEVSLLHATPEKHSEVTLAESDYRLTFSVVKRVALPVAKKCYVGGCSSEVCSDRPDVVSTCLYTEEFACYKTATCEVQASGECGWTMTDTLRMCIANARNV